MPNSYTHDLVATIGTYTDRQSGQEKKRYLTVGKGFTDEQGRFSFKVDALPVGNTWNGWLSSYPAKDRQQNHSSAPPSHTPPTEGYDDTDEDIPF